jgi:ribose transport system substrate-binding protein
MVAKKVSIICFGLILTLGLGTAFAQTSAGGTARFRGTDGSVNAADFSTVVKAKKAFTIAVVVKNQANAVWQSHLIASKKAGKDLGVKILDYAPTKADNVEEQKRILEDLVTAGVDAVVLAPANTEAVRGAVTDLLKAGIPVVYDNTMGPSDVDYTTFVGCDSTQAGEEIAKAIGKGMGGKGNLLVLSGVVGQSTSDLRTKAVLDYVKANFPNIKAESAVTNWAFDQGRNVTSDYITKWGDKLKGIVAVGGNQAEGAVEAVKAANMRGVLITGFDVQEPQFTAVEKGDEFFTVSQGVYEQAYLSVVACVKILNGEKVPRFIKAPITIVTKSNLIAMDERPEALSKR